MPVVDAQTNETRGHPNAIADVMRAAESPRVSRTDPESFNQGVSIRGDNSMRLKTSSELLVLTAVASLLLFSVLGFGQGSAESTVKGNVVTYVTDPSGATI